ncbi:MAG: hypothetical protein GYA57_11660, partial [Myxococcales bacterium]|nr:hypothetical protein [Myxococcales bacterium]
STYECRAAAPGGCDVAENCTGTGAACPTDAFRPSTYECRAAAPGGCDVAENCTGTGAACPPDTRRPDGTACTDGICCDGICQTGGNCCDDADCVTDTHTDHCDLTEHRCECGATGAPCPSTGLTYCCPSGTPRAGTCRNDATSCS